MKDFLFNLAILVVIGIVFVVVFPDMTRQVLEIFGGLGILPIFLLMVLLAALPRRKRRSRK